MYAILDERRKGNSANFVHLLLDAGADVNLQGSRYGNPLAVSSTIRPRIRQYLFSFVLILPVKAAVHKSNLPLVEKLMDLGANINAPAGGWGKNHQACHLKKN